MNIDNDEHQDSPGWQIVQKHAPFFKPSDLASAIDDTLAAQRQALRDEVMGALPEDKETFHIEIPDTLHRNIGFNQALAEMTQAISTIFEGKEKNHE